MSTEANKALVQGFFEDILHAGDVTAIPKYFPEGSFLAGSMANLAALSRAAHGEIQASLDELIAEGNKVVAVLTLRGIHNRAFMRIPPTGKRFEVTFIWVCKIEDGRIVSLNGVVDRQLLREQVGLAAE